MPNRIMRDWTDSEKMNSLDTSTERFFTRLIMKADDYGRLGASVKLLRCQLFPLLIDQVCEADITHWLTACKNAGLIALYEVDEKPYLQIENFNQRLRIKKGKYPAQPCTGYNASSGQYETETEHSETTANLTKNQGHGGAKTIDEKIKLLAARALKFKDSLRPFTEEYATQMLEDFFQYWSEANPGYTKLRFEMEKTWEVQKRLAAWATRSKNFTKKSNDGQNSKAGKGRPDTARATRIKNRAIHIGMG